MIVGKTGFGLVPGAEIDGKIINRPAITPGRGMAVSKYSKKKEVTMKVLEFISLPDQSLKIVMDAKTIMDPWRLSHLRSPIFRKVFPDADKYLDAIEAAFPYLVPDPVIPAADEYQRKLSFEITEALAKRKSAKEALDSAFAEWEKVTDRRGRDKQKAAWGEKLAEMKSLGIEYTRTGPRKPSRALDLHIQPVKGENRDPRRGLERYNTKAEVDAPHARAAGAG